MCATGQLNTEMQVCATLFGVSWFKSVVWTVFGFESVEMIGISIGMIAPGCDWV